MCINGFIFNFWIISVVILSFQKILRAISQNFSLPTLGSKFSIPRELTEIIVWYKNKILRSWMHGCYLKLTLVVGFFVDTQPLRRPKKLIIFMSVLLSQSLLSRQGLTSHCFCLLSGLSNRFFQSMFENEEFYLIVSFIVKTYLDFDIVIL